MAIQAMGSVNINVEDVNILKRPGYEGIAITLDSTAFTSGVCKAGSPIGKDGKIHNDNQCVGILLHDVLHARPQATILKKAYVDNAKIKAHYGTEIAAAAKQVLPMVVFE